MRPLRPLSLIAPLVACLATACGLDRPIEAQPLVSVVDEWRQSVLAQNASTLVGDPLEVPTAEVAGDFGELRWDDRLAAEGTGIAGRDMVVVELLAGGGRERWGMTIVGVYTPALSELEPGVRTRIASTDATIIGCSGETLFDWEYDQSAEVTTLDVEVDAADPSLAHYEFEGVFLDGSTMSGRFTVERPSGSAVTP